MAKKYDLVVTVGEYQDREGNTKKEYLNIGAIMENDKGPYLLLNRTFNPAGVPNPQNRGNLIVSMFEPKERQQGGTSRSDNRDQGDGYGSGGRPGGDPYEDEIPFNYEARA